MKVLVKLFLGFLVIGLAGCSYLPQSYKIHNRDKAYLEAKSIPPLRIPPGVASSTFHTAYPVPVVPRDGNENVDIVPPGLMN